MKKTTVLIFSIGLNILYLHGDNTYMGDTFNESHSTIKESFIRTVAKNKSHTNLGGSSYVEIKNKDEFKEALDSGKLSQKVNGNRITKTYRVIDIKNVRLNKNDLKDIAGERVLIGSKVEKDNEQLIQNISIRNSRLQTDKKLNVGVVSTTGSIGGIQSTVKIKDTQLKSSHKSRDSKNKSRLEMFDELESSNE